MRREEFRLKEEGIVPLIGVDRDSARWDARLLQRGCQSFLFVGIETDIGVDAEYHIALMSTAGKGLNV